MGWTEIHSYHQIFTGKCLWWYFFKNCKVESVSQKYIFHALPGKKAKSVLCSMLRNLAHEVKICNLPKNVYFIMITHKMILAELFCLYIKIEPEKVHRYIVDVLWCQPIKLIQVVSTSEFNEYWWNDIAFIFLSPLLSAGPQKPQTLTASKIKHENFWPKI